MGNTHAGPLHSLPGWKFNPGQIRESLDLDSTSANLKHGPIFRQL
jgi:hypothetical protein